MKPGAAAQQADQPRNRPATERQGPRKWFNLGLYPLREAHARDHDRMATGSGLGATLCPRKSHAIYDCKAKVLTASLGTQGGLLSQQPAAT